MGTITSQLKFLGCINSLTNKTSNCKKISKYLLGHKDIVTKINQKEKNALLIVIRRALESILLTFLNQNAQ